MPHPRRHDRALAGAHVHDLGRDLVVELEVDLAFEHVQQLISHPVDDSYWSHLSQKPELADGRVLSVFDYDTTGSFSRAASSQLVSQPSVSERVVRLERGLGVKLFDRGARGTSLTPEGSRFLPYAERVLALLDEATDAVRAVELARPVRIGVHTTFAHRAVPLVLDAIGHPLPKITVRDAHSDQAIAMLLDGLIDVGFVLPGARPPQLRFVRLPEDPVVPVCAPSHDLARHRHVSLVALRGRSIALNRWGVGAELFTEQLLNAGVAPSQITECSDGVTAMRLARDHGYVALVTRSLVDDAIDAGELERVQLRPAPRWSVPLALAYRARDHREPANRRRAPQSPKCATLAKLRWTVVDEREDPGHRQRRG